MAFEEESELRFGPDTRFRVFYDIDNSGDKKRATAVTVTLRIDR